MTNRTQNQAIYVSTGDPTSVNEPTPYAPGQLGKEITVFNSTNVSPGQGAKTFKYVQVDSTSASPYLGSVAFWSDRDNFKVTLAATNRGQVAGAFQASFPAPGNFGYIQTGGPATVKFVDAPTAAPAATGGFVIGSATAGKADCIAAGTASTWKPLGNANGAINAGDQTAEVILTLDGSNNP